MKTILLSALAIVGAFILGYGLEQTSAMFGIGGASMIMIAAILGDP